MSAHEKAEPAAAKSADAKHTADEQQPDSGVSHLNAQATEALEAIATLHDKAMTALLKIADPGDGAAPGKSGKG